VRDGEIDRKSIDRYIYFELKSYKIFAQKHQNNKNKSDNKPVTK